MTWFRGMIAEFDVADSDEEVKVACDVCVVFKVASSGILKAELGGIVEAWEVIGSLETWEMSTGC